MSRTPDFDELVGGEAGGEERERLRATHELLAQAGPPPELPPWLEQPPAPWLSLDERRRQRAQGPHRWSRFLVPVAAAAAALLLGIAIGGGRGGGSFHAVFHVKMHGTRTAAGALAILDVGDRDRAGNLPMILKVDGLKQLPQGGYYELFLTRHGRLAGSCGTFTVGRAVTAVPLNAPYTLQRGDGWVVVDHVPGQPGHRTVLTT
jgi:hypothetical protein